MALKLIANRKSPAKPDAPFPQLKAHKHFTYRVEDAGILHWERKQDTIAAETAHDGWYILHTNLTIAQADAAQVQGHYKNYSKLKKPFAKSSYLQVRPVFDRKPERVINYVPICFLA